MADPGPHELDRFAEGFLESFAGVVARPRPATGSARRRRAGAPLEETDRLRTALFQSVSHDLRTPLTAIRAAARGAARRHRPGRRARQMLDDIEREAGRLVRLVESMLDLSRVESGACGRGPR